MTDKADLDQLANVVHEAYSIIDDIAFRQQAAANNDTYLLFTDFAVKIKAGGMVYHIKVDSDMQRVVIEQLDESEDVPF